MGSRFFVADRNVSSVAPTIPPAMVLMSAENCENIVVTTKRKNRGTQHSVENGVEVTFGDPWLP